VNYKISIIIAVYNREKFLRRAFESLKLQTIGFENLQVIFADDCSTDTSWEIIQEFGRAHANVEPVRLPQNSGSGGAPRNAALGLAKAKYFMILDSDDEFTIDACRLLYDAIERTDVDFAYGYFSEVDAAGTVLLEKNKAFDNGEKVFHFPGDFASFVPVGGFFTKIYKTALVREKSLTLPHGIPGQDVVFFLSYLLACKTAYYIDKPVYKYTRHLESISYSGSKSYFLGLNQAYKLYMELLGKNGQSALLGQCAAAFLSFCFNKVLESKLLNDEVEEIFDAYAWLWDHCVTAKLAYWSESAQILDAVLPGKRLIVYKNLKEIRERELKLVNDNASLLQEINSRDKILNTKAVRALLKIRHSIIKNISFGKNEL